MGLFFKLLNSALGPLDLYPIRQGPLRVEMRNWVRVNFPTAFVKCNNLAWFRVSHCHLHTESEHQHFNW